MSQVQSLDVFHDFIIQYLGEVCALFALFMLTIYYLSCCTSVYSYDEDVDEDVEDVEDEDVDELDMTFAERLDHIETILSNQLELMLKLSHIENMSEQIEAEKAKGNLIDRLNSIEHKKLVYKFNITDFNNFCRSVYAEVESGSNIKKRSHIIKKVGKMWRDMEDEEKAVYSI
jgi:hypothetical protein